MQITSTRPYFIRALNDWINDNHLTPHLMVDATYPGVQVPEQHVKDGKIVLNIAAQAINALVVTNDWISFDARFSGVARQLRFPVKSVEAIYALENGRGMSFDSEPDDHIPPPPFDSTEATKKPERPSLKIVK